MPQLDSALKRLLAYEGVEHLFLLGRDGLLVRHLGPAGVEAETVAAMIPGLRTSCVAVGRAGDLGQMSTAVIEYGEGVAIVVSLSNDLLLALILRPGIGFSALLRDLRRQRVELPALL